MTARREINWPPTRRLRWPWTRGAVISAPNVTFQRPVLPLGDVQVGSGQVYFHPTESHQCESSESSWSSKTCRTVRHNVRSWWRWYP